MTHPYIDPFQTGTVFTDPGANQGAWQTEVMAPVTSAADTVTENLYGTVDSQGRVAIAYPTAARTATPTAYPLYTRYTPGVAVTVNVTAQAGGSVTPSILGQDPSSLSYYTLLTGTPITTTGLTRLVVSPGVQSTSTYGSFATTSATVTQPAAGADWVSTVPANQQWQPMTVTAKLVTSATVATRSIVLIIDDGTNIIWQSAASTQAASLTTTYTWSIPTLPVITMNTGWRIRTLTSLIQTGDQWSLITEGYNLATAVTNNFVADTIIPDTIKIAMTHNNASSITYSVGLDWQ